MADEIKERVHAYHAPSPKDWRRWLEKNHTSEKSVWLIIYHQASRIRSVTYPEAVDEALCFGWIDSKPNKRDKESYYQFFARRKPASNWSKLNKEKVERLIRDGRMAPAGLEMVRLAKENGTWNALDEVEQLKVPDDLSALFKRNPAARENWVKFPPSSRRGILEWIFNAKRPETRLKRIHETVEKAAVNIRANHYRQ